MKIKNSVYKIVFMLFGIGLVIFSVGYIAELLFYKDFSYNEFSFNFSTALFIFNCGVLLTYHLSEEVRKLCQYFGEKRKKKIIK